MSRAPAKAVTGALVFFTIPRAAAEFGQSAKRVRRLVAQGLLPARRLGGEVVLLKADLERFFAALPAVTTVDGALARIAARAQASGQGEPDPR
jgi:hypothetical protein